MKKEFKYYFSLVTGRVEQILPEEVKILETYQIPLKKKPHHSCKHCYGRGYSSFDRYNNAYIPCRCIKRCMDKEVTETTQISYYNPKW